MESASEQNSLFSSCNNDIETPEDKEPELFEEIDNKETNEKVNFEETSDGTSSDYTTDSEDIEDSDGELVSDTVRQFFLNSNFSVISVL